MKITGYIPSLTPVEKDMPFYLATIGKVTYQSIVHRPLGIEDRQLLYTLSGSGNVFIKGRTFELTAGSMLYLPSNTAHEYHCSADGWETLYITFGGDGVKKFWDFEPSIWENGSDFEFEKWFNILENYKKRFDKEKEISITLYAMLLDFKEKTMRVSKAASKKHILTLAMHEMSENAQPNLGNIAEKAGVSEAHFCRIFKEYTGFRPFEYINRLKIQKAKELLCSTDMSIKEICETVGYESHSYFSMLFKRYEGTPPSKFRKE